MTNKNIHIGYLLGSLLFKIPATFGLFTGKMFDILEAGSNLFQYFLHKKTDIFFLHKEADPFDYYFSLIFCGLAGK